MQDKGVVESIGSPSRPCKGRNRVRTSSVLSSFAYRIEYPCAEHHYLATFDAALLIERGSTGERPPRAGGAKERLGNAATQSRVCLRSWQRW